MTDMAAEPEPTSTTPDSQVLHITTIESRDDLDDDEGDPSVAGETRLFFGWPDCHDHDGKLRRLSDQCATCILRPGNPPGLSPGRLRDLVNAARRADTYVVCHETLLPAAPNINGSRPAACRGYWDTYGGGQLGRIMERLNGIVNVEPPATLSASLSAGSAPPPETGVRPDDQRA